VREAGRQTVFGGASTSLGMGAVIVRGTPLPMAGGRDSALLSRRKIGVGFAIGYVVAHILPPLALRHIALGASAGQADHIADINDEDTGAAIGAGGHDAPVVGTPRRVRDPIGVPAEGEQLAPRLRIPHPGAAIGAGGHDAPVVGTPRRVRDPKGVPAVSVARQRERATALYKRLLA
jgi:hypothetical protein